MKKKRRKRKKRKRKRKEKKRKRNSREACPDRGVLLEPSSTTLKDVDVENSAVKGARQRNREKQKNER